MIAGQIAAIRGCRVVGVARSEAKLSWLTDELGFDAALNSAVSGDLDGELAALCPHGIDVYFDNVGGAVTDAALRRINTHARIALCGHSSQHNLEEAEVGPRWLGQLIVKQAKMQGFRVSGYSSQFPAALEQLGQWQKQGRIRYREDVAQGIEAAPLAFIGMLLGKNQGKQLVQLSAY
jgi:NADPH-dependent curcumin reductase CurA